MYAHKSMHSDYVIGYLYDNECICNLFVYADLTDSVSGEMAIGIC